MDLLQEIDKKMAGRDPMHSTIVMVGFLQEVRDEIERLRAAEKLVSEQAEDEALWAVPVYGKQSIVEAYYQQELRRLHAVIENKSPEACARAVLD